MLRSCVGLAITQSPKPAGGYTVRVLIVDDEPLARRGVVLRLRKFKDVEIIGECGDGQSLCSRQGLSSAHPGPPLSQKEEIETGPRTLWKAGKRNKPVKLPARNIEHGLN
jgi:hypothetical protein